jgi:MFS family permease
LPEPAASDPQSPAPTPPIGHGVFRRTVAAFAYRDFRVLWLGACTSSIGTWMQSVAENWLVLTLTGSAFFLGLDSFLQQLPLVLFTLIGGVMADRYDRRRTLLVSQYVQLSTAFALAALVALDIVRVWHILALSFITGCAQSFGGPAYQSLLPSLVEKRDVPNAVAMNSIQFNIARMIGPLLAGATLAALGMAWCFALNGVSFLVVIVALMSLRVKHIAPVNSQDMATEMKLGLSYVRHEGALLVLTILAATTTLFGTPLLTLLPVFSQEVFHRGVEQYSVLMAFSGAGSVVGALFVAWLGTFRRMGLAALLVQCLYGVLVIGFAVSRNELLSYVILFAGGAALMIMLSLVTSLMQLLAPNHMRGRVMSIYMVAFRGGMPIGSLLSASFASATSAPLSLVVNGVLLVAVALYFLVRDHGIRRCEPI